MKLAPGTVFAGYRIIRLLGGGGMGAVYLAQHPRLPRNDALKLLSGNYATNPEFRGRFEREADITSSLRHPNIVSVYDRGAEGDQLWISMQYVEGTDAAELVKSGPSVLTVARVVTIVSDAARALDYAHRKGLLHRDVKPANILVTQSDDEQSGESALLTDFGIARAVSSATDGLTMAGFMVGTTAYAAPEMLAGGSIDHRVDIYALGCALFEMLTGSVPYKRDSLAAIMHAHLSAPPPVPSRARLGLPPAIDAVVARAMAKDPNQRYQTCRELATDAARALGHAPANFTTAPSFSATPPPQPQSPSSPHLQQHPTPPPQHQPAYYSSPGMPAGQPYGQQPPPYTQRPTSAKKWWIGGGVAAAVLALVLVLVLTMGGGGSSEPTTAIAGVTTSEEATSSDETTSSAAAEPEGETAESSDNSFRVTLPDGWRAVRPDTDFILTLFSRNDEANILVSINPVGTRGATIDDSANDVLGQVEQEFGGDLVVDSGGVEATTVAGEPAVRFTYTFSGDQQARGRQLYVRHDDIEYIMTFTGTIDTFNGYVADYEKIQNSWAWTS